MNLKRSTYAKYKLNGIPDIVTLIAIEKALNIDCTSMVKEQTITGGQVKPGEPASSQSHK